MKSSFSEYFSQDERKKSNGPDKMMILGSAKKADTICQIGVYIYALKYGP